MEKPCAYPLNTDAYLSPLANLRRQDFQFFHRINGTDKEFSIIKWKSIQFRSDKNPRISCMNCTHVIY